MKKIIMLSIIVILSGCTMSKTDDKPTVGMANPASVYCEKMGGKVEIVDTPQGQHGNCVLASGEKVEEWALYRRDHG